MATSTTTKMMMAIIVMAIYPWLCASLHFWLVYIEIIASLSFSFSISVVSLLSENSKLPLKNYDHSDYKEWGSRKINNKKQNKHPNASKYYYFLIMLKYIDIVLVCLLGAGFCFFYFPFSRFLFFLAFGGDMTDANWKKIRRRIGASKALNFIWGGGGWF